MGYFQPMVIYRDPEDKRLNSIVRYIGNRVLKSNKNFLCAYTGSTGSGKSYSCIKTAELYSEMFGIPFDPNVHIIYNLKDLLLLITGKDADKKIQFGSIIVFDEPQVGANARDWQSEMNQALSQLISTFRNQRLVVLFATPMIEMIDKQSRILFHGEFKVLGFDKATKITTIKPRFLEYNKKIDDFYRKRLIIQYKTPDKTVLEVKKLNFWHVGLANPETIRIYEGKKKAFTDDLNKKLLEKLELSEKVVESKNKSEEFFKVKEYYEKFGEDYVLILKEMPHMTPFVINKYIQFIKRGKKPATITDKTDEMD